MSAKFTFSDAEILYYGKQKKFTCQPEWSLLRSDPADDQDALWQAALHNTNLGALADYVSSSFMNPKQGFKVFAWTEGGFLRFRGSLPSTNDPDAGYAIIYTAGPNEGYLAYEQGTVIKDILDEMAGIPVQTTQMPPLELAPLDLLVILGICEVTLQNRYDDGWFTASAILNAYDHGRSDSKQRILFPLSAVAKDLLSHSMTHDNIQQALDAMVNASMMISKQIDDITMYRLADENQYLSTFFAASKHMLAIYGFDEHGNMTIQFVVSTDTMALCFTIDEKAGRIETAHPDRVCWATWFAFSHQTPNEETIKTGSFCIHCGHGLRPQAKFCPSCGKAT